MIPKNPKELATMLFAMEVNETGLDINSWNDEGLLDHYRVVARQTIAVANVFFEELRNSEKPYENRKNHKRLV